MHYHIIPAPKYESSRGEESTNEAVGGRAPPVTHREMHRKEFESREELDEDDAKVLLKKIRSRL